MKEVDRCDKIIIENSNLQVSSTDSMQNVHTQLDFSEKYTTEDVPKKVPLITKASPVKLSAESVDVDKVIVFKFTVLLNKTIHRVNL